MSEAQGQEKKDENKVVKGLNPAYLNKEVPPVVSALVVIYLLSFAVKLCGQTSEGLKGRAVVLYKVLDKDAELVVLGKGLRIAHDSFFLVLGFTFLVLLFLVLGFGHGLFTRPLLGRL